MIIIYILILFNQFIRITMNQSTLYKSENTEITNSNQVLVWGYDPWYYYNDTSISDFQVFVFVLLIFTVFFLLLNMTPKIYSNPEPLPRHTKQCIIVI